MTRETTLRRILDGGIVAVVRAESGERAGRRSSRRLAEGGVTAAEITFTVPNALDVIRQVRDMMGDKIVLGAGTVLDPETARAALLAGAEYIVAPTTNPGRDPASADATIRSVHAGRAFTPTEVLTAWEAGADDA